MRIKTKITALLIAVLFYQLGGGMFFSYPFAKSAVPHRATVSPLWAEEALSPVEQETPSPDTSLPSPEQPPSPLQPQTPALFDEQADEAPSSLFPETASPDASPQSPELTRSPARQQTPDLFDEEADETSSPPIPEALYPDASQQTPDLTRSPARPRKLDVFDEKRELLPLYKPPRPKKDVFGPKIGIVDKVQGEISHRVLSTATWLDSFFEDELSLREDNNSFVRFRYDQYQEEEAKTTFKPNIDLRLRLPQLQEKTHLVLSAEQTETPAPGAPDQISTNSAQISNPVAVTPQPADQENRNATAALHYIFKKTVQESIIVRSGAQFSKGKPVLFAAPRYRSLFPLNPWNARFTQEAVYRTDTLWQSETSLDLERQLPHDLFFHTGLQGVWMAGINGYFYNLGLSLRQSFSPTNAVQYNIGNTFWTRPSYKWMESTIGIQYRHSVWRRWLFFEVIPQIRFPRDRNFEATPGLLLRLEMYFGSLD